MRARLDQVDSRRWNNGQPLGESKRQEFTEERVIEEVLDEIPTPPALPNDLMP